MRIRRLRMRDFRLYDDVELLFEPGMNLIRGPNESGKSTIVNAIVAALFAKPHSRSIAAKANYRWGSDRGPLLELEFEHEGEILLLVKDFEEKTATLEPLEGGSGLDTTKAVESRVAEIVGFENDAHYLRTACVTHDQMVGLAQDGGGARKLAAMLREVVVGGRDSALVDGAVKELSDRIDELKRGLERPSKNPGVILRLQGRKHELEQRQASVEREVSEFERHQERLSDVERALEEKSPRLGDLGALLEKNSEIRKLEERRGALAEHFEAADRVRQSRSELQRIEAGIESDYPRFEELDPAIESELRRACADRTSLQEQKAETLTDLSRKKEATGKQTARWPWVVTSVVGLAAIASGGALVAGRPAFLSLIIAGIVLLGIGIYLTSRSVRGTSDELLGFLDEKVSRLESDIEDLEDRENEILESVGYPDAESFLAAYCDFSEMKSERDRLKTAVASLVGDRSLDEVEKGRKEASIEVTSIDARLEELEPSRLGPERYEAIMRERDSLSDEVNELEKDKEGLTFYMTSVTIDPEEALRLEETVSWLSEEEQRATRRLRVLSHALDAMEQARDDLLSSAVPVLAESVGKTFSSLTGGRYDTVEVDESDLSISVYSSEKGETIPADEVLTSLSKGTVSQLYLAARLQIADQLSGGRKPPLVFDDSFSYFDDERVGRLWELLLEASADRQILLFTCTDRYDELAAGGVNVVELGRSE